MNQDPTRLSELLDLALGGTPTDDECDELRRLLDSHPELRPSVVEQLRTNGLLKWAMAPASDRVPAPSVPAPKSIGPAAKRRAGPWRLGMALAAFATAAALLVVLLTPTRPAGQGPTGQGGVASDIDANTEVARLVGLRTADFGDETAALFGEDRLRAGLLEIESGALEIEFASGVEMRVDGPARFEVVSPMLVKLLHGQATAEVPRWARGFTIETPDIEIVDLGTRFGVSKRQDGATDVVVFQGEVDMKSLDRSDRRFERRLTQGEAARINDRGEIERIFQVHGDAIGAAWSTLERLEAGVIGQVWDNFGATKSVSYYQVITEGFGEDTPAYVDHPHEWNGLTDAGLPDYLRGADYVRTVNDYRYRNELSLHVELADEAVLYVLFDNRTAAPAWLTEQFEDTGDDVGLDEDAWDGNPGYTVESGAGRSIDNAFSVWRRRAARGETLVLGSMGPGREARAMFGLAAKRP